MPVGIICLVISLLTLYFLVSAEFAVEVCSNKGYSSLRASSSMTLTKDTREPVIRYRHKKSNKYLCFSRSGRVRVWVSIGSTDSRQFGNRNTVK